MDINTMMQLMGMFGGGQTGEVPRYGAGALGNAPNVLSAASQYPAPTPMVVGQPNAPAAPAATPAPTTTAPTAHKGGFTTGHILNALLGSNFGQK